MKKMLAIGFIVMAATMTAVVGYRLSTDALSIIVGAILGMMAILPTIALGAFVLKKNQESAPQQQPPPPQQPPVVVVSGGMMPSQYFQPQQQQSPQPANMLPRPSQRPPRKFHLMGYEDTEQIEISNDDWPAAG